MFAYNRRPYINRQPEQKNDSSSNENNDLNTLKTITADSLKLLSKNINEIKQSLKKIEQKFVDLDLRVIRLETQIDNDETPANVHIQSDITAIKSELEALNKDTLSVPQDQEPQKNVNMPVMPGSGFANITAEYLKSLQKNR